jgi:serine/threonine-protein kinase
MVDISTELPAGKELGRYRIEETISRGATGAVYRAHGLEHDVPVAIKRMLTVGPVARFEIEARLLSRLRHPRVVDVLDHFADDEGRYCIVMSLVTGRDLGQVLWDRGAPGLPIAEVLEWTRAACDALAYLHAEQVVHGDVKPQNLIQGPQGVVLVDFGSAAQIQAGTSGPAASGTPRYMAPEVFAGGPLSPLCDVFSLAATAWTLLSGSPPAYGEETTLTGRVTGVTDSVEAALRHAMELVPERRLASAQALAETLGEPLVEGQGASLAVSIDSLDPHARALLERVAHAAAGVFEAAAASIAVTDPITGELVYQAAWGAGAEEIVGLRLAPGVGVAQAVVASGEAQAVADCRADGRFAAAVARGTGYIPHTMLVVPLGRDAAVVGVLAVLDRRDGRPYETADVPRAELLADLAHAALNGRSPSV